MDLPTQFAGSTDIPPPFDNIPTNIDLSTISYVGQFLSAHLRSPCLTHRVTVKEPENGEGVTFNSKDVDPVGDQERTTVETVLLRFQTDYTPSGSFPISVKMLVRTFGLTPRSVGYDAAVCVQKYEPWIVETYNTSIVSPSTFRIVEKGNGSNSSSPSGNIRGTPIASTGYLNATGKEPAFAVAHANSINQMVKDSSGDLLYVPSLTVGPVVPPRTTFT